ncbi:hypothetical protein N836_16875 [Leptolyngbya sp. Heron Island J]|uniref:hypothetical protein n=1 Tax=Leptolyngbya sp. Heron Island J TaxID=1385935 RepID=UPI0003B9C2BD|nr:hypothetical protein [Leptolyngbya sp. Heron Island J]ESA34450.1 hypothetical protein N836_16875 [Leptolyngbya sp. Heron Island J]
MFDIINGGKSAQVRQLRHNQRELVIRFANLGRHHIARSVTNLARLGVFSLVLVVWLGYQQAPLLWVVLMAIGILLIMAEPFVPVLYPEIATCIFNKAFNRFTIVHEIPRGRKKPQRRINHYRLSHIEQVQVYRRRLGLWRWNYVMLIRVSSPANTIIHVNGLSDQVLIQTGNHPIQLLSKTVRYHLGRRTAVDWSFVTVPRGISTTEISRPIVARNSMTRLDKFDLRRIAQTIEQFIWSP